MSKDNLPALIENTAQKLGEYFDDEQLAQRMLISLNNICESIGHVSTEQMYSEIYGVGVSHG